MPSIEFKLRIRGLKELGDRLRQAAADLPTAVSATLYQFGEEVMTESKLRVPVLTGTLMNTGHVDLPQQNGTKITVKLGYGGPAAPYALYVHEEMVGAVPPSPNWSWTKKYARVGHIDYTRPGSGPKYLENPLKEKQDQLPGRIRDAVQKVFKKP